MMSPMTNAEFWAIIDGAAKKAKGDNQVFLGAVTERLGEEPAERLLGFQAELAAEINRAYRWDLWDAASVMLGGCGDDHFEYFRAWLVSRGKAVFEAALNNPDSLASISIDDPVEECECEFLLPVAMEAYEEQTELDDFNDRVPSTTSFDQPQGTACDKHGLPKQYPKLWKKYGNS